MQLFPKADERDACSFTDLLASIYGEKWRSWQIPGTLTSLTRGIIVIKEDDAMFKFRKKKQDLLSGEKREAIASIWASHFHHHYLFPSNDLLVWSQTSIEMCPKEENEFN